jgi:putative transposase
MMTNHVYLLCTPRLDGGISSMMQALGCPYVRYLNYEYNRNGTLWEGRYKSCLIQEQRYLLEVYRYIELNPIRDRMVKTPGDYRWSSYSINALGKVSALCTSHPEYLKLGIKSEERLRNYQALFSYELDTRILDQIRGATNKGMVFGSDRFVEEIEALTGRRVRGKKRGRLVGWRKVAHMQGARNPETEVYYCT